jgi:hypothetical protein
VNEAWTAASGAEAAALEAQGNTLVSMFGAYENGDPASGLLALPEIAWEASLGIYAAWKGFRPSPIAEPAMA